MKKRILSMQGLFSVLAIVCFGYIMLQPIWNYNPTTIRTTILFIIGWVSAHLSQIN